MSARFTDIGLGGPYQSGLRGKPFVRLTLLPGGTNRRRRTLWAIQESPYVFRRVDDECSIWRDPTAGEDVIREEVIIVAASDFAAGRATIEPAQCNLHYARMEVKR